MKSIINILNKYTNNLASIRVLAYFPELCYLKHLMAIIRIIKELRLKSGKYALGGTNTFRVYMPDDGLIFI